jgi:hypothetical protein
MKTDTKSQIQLQQSRSSVSMLKDITSDPFGGGIRIGNEFAVGKGEDERERVKARSRSRTRKRE